MNPEKTITIFGKEVKMLYCAGAETSFETLSDHKVTVFFPTISEYDENGNEICYIDYENYKGERRLYSKREYNENGDITLDYRLPLYGIYRHEYEYDAYGQLLRSTEYIKE